MKKNGNSEDKGRAAPKLTVPEIILYCKEQLGISFNLMSEEVAARFLEKHNTFFRLKQYAEICPERTKSGKYVGLDFGQLVELSTIDMFFRKLVLKMTIDLEHYMKVNLVNDCQNNQDDDGYEVVRQFLKSHPSVATSIRQRSYSAGYGGANFEKYIDQPSVWSIVEMLGFLDFTAFYDFYYKYFKIPCEHTKHFDSVRRLRNASAHNVCMLCNFRPAQNFKNDIEVTFELLQTNIGISNGVISNSMKVPVLNDFTVMLSVYTKMISSPEIKEKTLREILDFFDGRMISRKHYFEGNSDIKNVYHFARAVLEFYATQALQGEK